MKGSFGNLITLLAEEAKLEKMKKDIDAKIMSVCHEKSELAFDLANECEDMIPLGRKGEFLANIENCLKCPPTTGSLSQWLSHAITNCLDFTYSDKTVRNEWQLSVVMEKDALNKRKKVFDAAKAKFGVA